MNIRIRTALLCCSLLSATASAVQPLDEDGLGGISADAGVNVLNLFGAPAAGIALDTDTSDAEASGDAPFVSGGILNNVTLPLTETRHNEGDEAAPAAEQQLTELERSLQALTQTDDPTTAVSADIIEKIIAASDVTLREASVVENSSSLQFRSEDFQHNTDFIDADTVTINRRLLIERLSLENLTGDDGSGDRSAGSIFISNWSSLGGARISTD